MIIILHVSSDHFILTIIYRRPFVIVKYTEKRKNYIYLTDCKQMHKTGHSYADNGNFTHEASSEKSLTEKMSSVKWKGS